MIIKYPFIIKTDGKTLIVTFILDRQSRDYLIVKFKRDLNSKGIYFFNNGCPSGHYILTDKLKRVVIERMNQK